MKVAAHTLLVEPSSAGKEETWVTLLATFPTEDHTNVSAAAASVLPASATEVENGISLENGISPL